MRPSAFAAYRAATCLLAPLMPLYLRRRERRGKEEPARLGERLGAASLARPPGKLLWLHAASVGEANSVLPLIEAIRARFPAWHMLLTTGTVTSAALMRSRLPAGVMHQYVPVDTPRAVARFVAHWKPDAALWVESELWPNLLDAARSAGCRLLLINARMSERSFAGWRRAPKLIAYLLGCFEVVFAQSEEDGARYRALGAARVECVGNMKYDAAPLPADAALVAALTAQTAGRTAWLAASLHPGEVALVAAAHLALRARFPGVLTVVVPRHPAKGAAMRQSFAQAGLRAALRSERTEITPETEVYIADTLGELGLFYRAFPRAFIGGSLVAHGGQNPLEAARTGCAILFGPHMFNFTDIARGLLRAEAAREVADARALAAALEALFTHPPLAAGMAARASAWVLGQGGVNTRLLEAITPVLSDA